MTIDDTMMGTTTSTNNNDKVNDGDEEEDTKLRDSIMESLEKEGEDLGSILQEEETKKDDANKDTSEKKDAEDAGDSAAKKDGAGETTDKDASGKEDTSTNKDKDKDDSNDDRDKDDNNAAGKKGPYKVKMSVEERWNKFFEKLKAFYDKHKTYQVTGDDSLERWTRRQRTFYHNDRLKPERVEKLKAIGFDFGDPPKHKGDTWITTKPWHERIEQLVEFKIWHGHCNVPSNYEVDPSLHRWVWKQQKRSQKGKLRDDQVKCLKSLGISGIGKDNDSNEKKRKRDAEEEDGDDDDDDENDTDDEEEEDLSVLEVPIIKSTWETHFDLLKEFKKEVGHTNVTTKHDVNLGNWATRQRQHYRQNTLHPDRILKLEMIGFQWKAPHAKTHGTRSWKDQYYILKKFKKQRNHTSVPTSYKDQELVTWVQEQRRDKKDGTLDQKSIDLLDELEFDWNGPCAAPAANTPALNNTLTVQQNTPTTPQNVMPQQSNFAGQQPQALLQQQQRNNLTAQQQFAYAQYQRQFLAAGGYNNNNRQALAQAANMMRYQQQQLLNNQNAIAAARTAAAGWGGNNNIMRNGMGWGGTPAAAAPVPTAAAKPSTTIDNSKTSTTSTEKNTTDPAKRVKELEAANTQLTEENAKLKKEKYDLMTENTNLKTTLEEVRQAYKKENKSLQEQVEDHSTQIKEQADQAKKQMDQMQQMMQQMQEMREFHERMQKESTGK